MAYSSRAKGGRISGGACYIDLKSALVYIQNPVTLDAILEYVSKGMAVKEIARKLHIPKNVVIDALTFAHQIMERTAILGY
jgi:uncharacterized protein (DUF433 family)